MQASPSSPAPDSTRDRLLAVALPLFAERNLEGVSVRQIATAARQNVAAISYHFGSKDALYLAVLDRVVFNLHSRVAPILDEIPALSSDAPIRPADAIDVLKRLFRRMFESALARQDDMAVERLIIREQTRPTPGFDVIYEHGLRRMHEALTALVAAASGESRSANRTIIRAHALLGQLLGFMISRETIRRRLGHPVLTPTDSSTISSVIDEHLDLVLDGLRRRRQS